MEEQRENEKLKKRKRRIMMQLRDVKEMQREIEREWQKNCIKYFIAFLRIKKDIIRKLYFQMNEWNILENKKKLLKQELEDLQD